MQLKRKRDHLLQHYKKLGSDGKQIDNLEIYNILTKKYNPIFDLIVAELKRSGRDPEAVAEALDLPLSYARKKLSQLARLIKTKSCPKFAEDAQLCSILIQTKPEDKVQAVEEVKRT